MKRFARCAAVLLAMALWGCAPDGPHVSLTITSTGPLRLNELARLRMIVRACGRDRPPVLQDLPTTPSANGAAQKIEAGLIPGETFYVWLQGWAICSATPCVPEDTAMLGKDCECIAGGQPPMQILSEEFCTRWMRATDGRTVVNATLHPLANDCPPLQLSDCSSIPL